MRKDIDQETHRHVKNRFTKNTMRHTLKQLTITDTSLLYHWDFSRSQLNYNKEIISNGDPSLSFVENAGIAFRSQATDVYNQTGIVVDQNSSFQIDPISEERIASINMDNFTLQFQFSIEDDMLGATGLIAHTKDLTFKVKFCYNYNDVSSTPTDDANVSSGFALTINAGANKIYNRVTYLGVNDDGTFPLIPTHGNIWSYDPAYPNFYDHSTSTQGQFPLDVSKRNQTITIRTRIEYSSPPTRYYEIFIDNVMYVQFSTGLSNKSIFLNKTIPFLTIEANNQHGSTPIMNMKSIKIFNKTIPNAELPHQTTLRYPYSYHYICSTYAYEIPVGASIEKGTSSDYKVIFNQTANVYNKVHKTEHLLDLSINPVWYEFEMYYTTSTTVFGMEFFNETTNTNYGSVLAGGYFNISYAGVAFGIINGKVNYRVGNQLIDTKRPVDSTLHTYSIYITDANVSFYFDKEYIGGLPWISPAPVGGHYHSIFNVGSGSNSVRNLVKHATTNLSQDYPIATPLDRTVNFHITGMPSISNNATVMNDLRFYKQDGTELDYELVSFGHADYIMSPAIFDIDIIKTTLTGNGYIIWRFFEVDAPADQQVIFDIALMTLRIPRDAFRMVTQFNDTSRTPAFRIDFVETPASSIDVIQNNIIGYRDTYFTDDGTATGLFIPILP